MSDILPAFEAGREAEGLGGRPVQGELVLHAAEAAVGLLAHGAAGVPGAAGQGLQAVLQHQAGRKGPAQAGAPAFLPGVGFTLRLIAAPEARPGQGGEGHGGRLAAVAVEAREVHGAEGAAQAQEPACLPEGVARETAGLLLGFGAGGQPAQGAGKLHPRRAPELAIAAELEARLAIRADLEAGLAMEAVGAPAQAGERDDAADGVAAVEHGGGPQHQLHAGDAHEAEGAQVGAGAGGIVQSQAIQQHHHVAAEGAVEEGRGGGAGAAAGHHGTGLEHLQQLG